MKEIKFRAWDKQIKKMVPVWGIYFKAWDRNIDGGHTINYVSVELDGTVERMSHDVELMQSTGLKDKKGIDVFEGDIVKCNIFLCGDVLATVKSGIGTMDCGCYVYSGIFFEVDGKKVEDTNIPDTISDGFVVGNIFEGVKK